MAPLKEAARKAAKTPRANHADEPTRKTPQADPAPETADRREALQRREILDIERDEPLQRRILRALAVAPRTPSELVRELGASKEGISRLLTPLLQSALVEYGRIEGDKRRRLYRLTPDGERTLRRHLRYGAPDRLPAAPGHDQSVSLARVGLDNALRMRRQANRLDEAAGRMRIVLGHAQELGDNELLIDTMAELAATFRQARRYEELDVVLDELEQMTLGEHPSGDPALVLPAAAHREYELGRSREGGITNAAARARHLDAAQSLYCQLGRSAEPRRRAAWTQREGWSVLSLASNLRERSHFEQAVEKASWAMSRFQSIDDDYGQSRSLFVIGLCLRLMGDFRNAWTHLAQALTLAQDQTYERFQADTLLQMGDVRRCMGHIEPARLLLSEALDQAVRMDIPLMQAFALSSLGACAYQDADYELARAELNRAQALFKDCAHREGLALNTRRQAVVKYGLYQDAAASALSALKRVVGSAHRQYEDLRSPAGAAACDIQLGRVCLIVGVSPERPIANLKQRLANPYQRDLIELDPWVPSYLLDFSKTAGDKALRASAKSMLTEGQRRRRAWYSQIIGPATGTDPIKGVQKGVLEMGGESRHAASAVQPVTALSALAIHSAAQTLERDLGQGSTAALFVPAQGSIHVIAG
jgi:DNA-binding MarR family transcriptional regulator